MGKIRFIFFPPKLFSNFSGLLIIKNCGGKNRFLYDSIQHHSGDANTHRKEGGF